MPQMKVFPVRLSEDDRAKAEHLRDALKADSIGALLRRLIRDEAKRQERRERRD